LTLVGLASTPAVRGLPRRLRTMAAATQRGYDPVAMAWTQVDVQQAATTENGPSNLEDEGLFQLVSLRRKASQRKMATKGGAPAAPLPSKLAAVSPGGIVSNGSACAAQTRSKTTTWRPRDTQKMRAEDIIVVLKPRETLHLKTVFQAGDLGAAIAQYVGGEAGATLNVWPVWTQNLIVCGTQHGEAANKLVRDFNLNVGSGSVPLRGHVKLNGEVCRGVIPVRTDETTASLKGKVVWREGELAFVRKLGTSNVVVLTFVGRRGKFRRLHRPGTQQHGAPNNKTSKPSGNGGASSGKFRQATGPATGNKTSYSEKNKNRKASTRSAKSGARTKAPTDNAGDFPPLETAHTKVRGWVGAVPGPLSPSPSPTEIALQKQNAELRRQTEILANKIQTLEAKLARLTEPQAQNGPSEPMQQAEQADHYDRASVAITPAVTDSVLSTVQKRSSVQYESSRSRSRSPRPDSRRRRGVPRQTTGSLEHSPAAPCPEMMVPLPEAPSPSGDGPRNKVIVEKFEIIQWNCRGCRSWKKRSHLQLYLQTLGTAPAVLALQEPGAEAKLTGYSSFQGVPQPEDAASLVDSGKRPVARTLTRTPPTRRLFVAPLVATSYKPTIPQPKPASAKKDGEGVMAWGTSARCTLYGTDVWRSVSTATVVLNSTAPLIVRPGVVSLGRRSAAVSDRRTVDDFEVHPVGLGSEGVCLPVKRPIAGSHSESLTRLSCLWSF
ncbi:hypothetical protein HPB47_026074, partial [Ixodes persulcatus]